MKIALATIVASAPLLLFQNCSGFKAQIPIEQKLEQESSAPVIQEDPGYDIFIIAGQSNAAGYGGGDFFDRLSLPQINDKIFQLGRYGADEMKVVPAGDQLQHWLSKNDLGQLAIGIGMGAAFARRYASTYLASGRKVLLIPAGFGGSPSFLWDDLLGNWTIPYSLGEPYTQIYINGGDSTVLIGDLIARIKVALQQPGRNRVMGLLWHQGETDSECMNPAAWCNSLTPNPTTYMNRLSSIVNRLRTEAGTQFPLVVGKFVPLWSGSSTSSVYRVGLESALAQVGSVIPLSACAETEGLKANSEVVPGSDDTIHFSAQSQINLGVRYFEAYQSLGKK